MTPAKNLAGSISDNPFFSSNNLTFSTLPAICCSFGPSAPTPKAAQPKVSRTTAADSAKDLPPSEFKTKFIACWAISLVPKWPTTKSVIGFKAILIPFLAQLFQNTLSDYRIQIIQINRIIKRVGQLFGAFPNQVVFVFFKYKHGQTFGCFFVYSVHINVLRVANRLFNNVFYRVRSDFLGNGALHQ